MSRELKFRVWSEDQKTYDYKFPYNSIGDFYVNTRGKVFSDFGNAVAPELRRDAFVVEQYTGLKDINGKEIYEGDIVRVRTVSEESDIGVLVAPIVWYKYKYCLGRPTTAASNGWTLRYESEFIEIIGNIHDNPELIKDDTMGN